MNSLLADVMTVYDGVLLDASHTWPTATKFFEMDKTYLRKACGSRGIPFITVTLPDLGKAFDMALSSQVFLSSSVPQGIPMIQKRPKLFGALFMKIFHECGTLRDDADIDAIAFFRQLCYLAKSLAIDCPPEATEKTVKEFFDIEASLPSAPQQWLVDSPTWRTLTGHPLWGPKTKEKEDDLFGQTTTPGGVDFDWDDFRQLCRRIISGFGTPDWWELVSKHGPGAVSDRGWRSKYDFPYWPRKLANWFPFDWFGSGNLSPDYVPDDREPASRLVAVPKSFKGPRLICAEPMAHQWMQQSIWRWLEERIRSSPIGRSIDFRSQESSRKLALSSSLDRRYCTIDLSSASDRLTCRLVEYVFQGSEILEGMHASRTRLLSQGISKAHGSHLVLKKFSTQGSALTFPVQTIVFTLLSVFALRTHEGRCGDWSKWTEDFSRVRVFGDDIIVPNDAYETMCSLLGSCGLKVNAKKSFSAGNFREACGMDAFMGVDVTPAHLLQTYTGSPESTQSLVECANNFHTRGYWNASAAVAGLIPKQEVKILPIVGRYSGSLGLRSFCGDSFGHLKTRWNKSLQKIEYNALNFTSKVDKVHGRDTARLSQFFFERRIEPWLVHLSMPWSSGQVERRKRICKARAWVSL